MTRHESINHEKLRWFGILASLITTGFSFALFEHGVEKGVWQRFIVMFKHCIIT